ncbi:MAG: Rha family transcriptional regulator [Desulfarculales bacterium]|jgi:Rha family phage regulatory protein|nr:Rha family transcriptional regulator [Desulfarculales bacterium]
MSKKSEITSLPVPVKHPSLQPIPPEIRIIIRPGDEPRTSSRDIAKDFGKEHKNVLREIQELRRLCPYEFNRLNFELIESPDKLGRLQPEYLLTKDGCSLLIMGFGGARALGYKLAYIEAYNKALEAARLPKDTAGRSALLETLLALTPKRLAQLNKLVSCRRRGFTRLETAKVMDLHPRTLGYLVTQVKKLGMEE